VPPLRDRCRRVGFTSASGPAGWRPMLPGSAGSRGFPLHSIISMAATFSVTTPGQQINTTRVAGLRIAYFAAAGSMRAVFQCWAAA